MSSIVNILLSWVLLYKYALLFVALFFDGLAVPIPGNTLLLASGAFASQGYMNYFLALFAVVLGNSAGDAFCYWLAKRYGELVIRKLHINRRYLHAVEGYARAHPRITIFVSRFIGPLDPAVNVLAGLVALPFRLFIMYDLLGNLSISLIIVSIGYILGSYWQSFIGILSIAGWVLFALVAALLIMTLFRKQLGITEFRIIKRVRRKVKRYLRRNSDSID